MVTIWKITFAWIRHPNCAPTNHRHSSLLKSLALSSIWTVSLVWLHGVLALAPVVTIVTLILCGLLLVIRPWMSHYSLLDLKMPVAIVRPISVLLTKAVILVKSTHTTWPHLSSGVSNSTAPGLVTPSLAIAVVLKLPLLVVLLIFICQSMIGPISLPPL